MGYLCGGRSLWAGNGRREKKFRVWNQDASSPFSIIEARVSVSFHSNLGARGVKQGHGTHRA